MRLLFCLFSFTIHLCVTPLFSEDLSEKEGVEEFIETNVKKPSASKKYVSQTIRQTHWINDIADYSSLEDVVHFDDRLHSITELGYSPNEKWGLDLGFVLSDSDDTNDLIDSFFGGFHGRNMRVKFELAEITGGITHQNTVISDPSVDKFTNNYRYIAVGRDIGFSNDNPGIPATFGVAFVQYEVPTVSSISYNDININLPSEFLDVDTKYTALGLWVSFDNMRNSMYGKRTFGAKKLLKPRLVLLISALTWRLLWVFQNER